MSRKPKITPELLPRYYYDCGHCKMAWACGPLCACWNTKLPETPAPWKKRVDYVNEKWAKLGYGKNLGSDAARILRDMMKRNVLVK